MSDQSKDYIKELATLTKKYPIAISYQKLTVAGTAVSLTVPADASYAMITLESSIATAAVRYLELGAGSLPTSSDGLVLFNIDRTSVIGYQNLINFRAIQVGAGTHTLHIQYYK